MVNVHLNGDIIQCPDMARIKEDQKVFYASSGRCIYGIRENNCVTWLRSEPHYKAKNIQNINKRCTLCKGEQCPEHARRVEIANRLKTFSIDNSIYRKISSAAHYMIKASKYKTLFLTLTFPAFKENYYLQPEKQENEINQAFSRFMDNLHNNYGVKNYIAVREGNSYNLRYHFHILLSIKFVDFCVINSAWCSAISTICDWSSCALRTNKKNYIVSRPGHALRYACKYFSKARGTRSKSRIVFISRFTLQKPIRENLTVREILADYSHIQKTQTSDFTIRYRIVDYKQFDKFCNQYLYALFELSDKKLTFEGTPPIFN